MTLAKKPIKITEVVLRDAHQSLLATRMTMDEMRPILPEMDKIPYFSVECWGGATFDSCIRFLDEDPWERLRILRKELPHQKLQMLFRGQNMLGYRPYADDAVEYFVQKSVANGIDVIRIFDALNDPRNLQTAIKAANKEGAHVQGCISYTLSPVHNNEYYVKYAKTLQDMGANSICVKDMAGLLTPYTCYDLISELKKELNIPVDIHSHYTAGLASMSLLKGIEAGADIVDTAMSPLSGGTSHMATESLVAALQGTDYDTGLDLKQLNVVRAYFAKLREKYIANGQISPKSLGVDANTLLYQVPGGMFSNMLKQLKDAGKEDKLDEVLAEIPRVREDAGYPPLVTPTSQIVGTQAVFNVILGERYKMVTKEFKGLVHGDYGKTPAPIKPEFTKKILGDEQPITCRFADTLAPEMDKLKAEAAKWATQEEDVLTYAMFPQVAPKFFDKRNAKKQGVDGDHAGDVDLAMVADDEDIGIILDARVLDGLEQLAQPQIHLMQGMGDLGGEDAGLMAIGVDVGGMDHQQAGLELADHRAGAGVYKQIALRMLAVHAVHQVHVGLDDLFNHLRRGAGSGEALQRGFLGGLRPILVYQIIDIGVLARNRPENGGGGHAGLLGRVKDIAHLDGGIEKLPVGGQFAQDGLLVVDDAVLAAVRAGAHAGVVGIGDGGIHRAHAIDERALIPDAAKAGQLTQGLQILVNHGVLRNDDQMLCLAHMQDLLFLWLIAPVDSVHSETTGNPPAPHTRPSCWDTGLYTRPGAFDRLPPRRDRAYIRG